MPPPNTCSIFSLEWASPLPALQTFYLSFILQSTSKCLFPNPHLPLALAESVAPTGLCLHFHYNIDHSGLRIIVCAVFPTRWPAPWGQGVCYLFESSQSPAIIACYRVDISVYVAEFYWKDLQKLNVVIFDNCSLWCVKQTKKMKERGFESGSLLSHYSTRSVGDCTEMPFLKKEGLLDWKLGQCRWVKEGIRGQWVYYWEQGVRGLQRRGPPSNSKL